MREEVDTKKLERFLTELGKAAKGPGRVYLTGGASALLIGWRAATIDVDLKFNPEPNGVFEAIPRLKNLLDINIELAAPDDFVPALPGWKERSSWIVTHNQVDFYHFDFYTQALSKIERNLSKDESDVVAMIEADLVDPDRLLSLVQELTDEQWGRYPSLEPEIIVQNVNSISENYGS